MVLIILALISFLLGMETIVDIIGLVTKIDTTLIVGIIVEIHVVAKIDVSITIEKGRVYSLVDDVLDTLVNDILS